MAIAAVDGVLAPGTYPGTPQFAPGVKPEQLSSVEAFGRFVVESIVHNAAKYVSPLPHTPKSEKLRAQAAALTEKADEHERAADLAVRQDEARSTLLVRYTEAREVLADLERRHEERALLQSNLEQLNATALKLSARARKADETLSGAIAVHAPEVSILKLQSDVTNASLALRAVESSIGETQERIGDLTQSLRAVDLTSQREVVKRLRLVATNGPASLTLIETERDARPRGIPSLDAANARAYFAHVVAFLAGTE